MYRMDRYAFNALVQVVAPNLRRNTNRGLGGWN